MTFAPVAHAALSVIEALEVAAVGNAARAAGMRDEGLGRVHEQHTIETACVAHGVTASACLNQPGVTCP